jgi:hypothetical protein
LTRDLETQTEAADRTHLAQRTIRANTIRAFRYSIRLTPRHPRRFAPANMRYHFPTECIGRGFRSRPSKNKYRPKSTELLRASVSECRGLSERRVSEKYSHRNIHNERKTDDVNGIYEYVFVRSSAVTVALSRSKAIQTPIHFKIYKMERVPDFTLERIDRLPNFYSLTNGGKPVPSAQRSSENAQRSAKNRQIFAK